MPRPKLLLLMLVCLLSLNAWALLWWTMKGFQSLRHDNPPPSGVVDSGPTSSLRNDTLPAASTREISKPQQHKKFHWTDIDAPDFPGFVKNLRGIGCPEATIRDIVAGELREIYAARQRDARHRFSTGAGVFEAQLEQQLSALTVEEAALLAKLTEGRFEDAPSSSPVSGGNPSGLSPAGSPGPDAATVAGEIAPGGDFADDKGGDTTERGSSAASLASVVSMVPVAFSVGNDAGVSAATQELTTVPTDPNLDPQSASVIRDIRDAFSAGMGKAGLDPSSPLYRQRWLLEQRRADERFSSLYGGDLFVRLQTEAAQKAYQAALQATQQNAVPQGR